METEESLIASAQPGDWYESKTYKSLLAAFTILRWVIVALVFAIGVYVFQRDSNAQQIANDGDNQRELQKEKQTLADYKADTDRQIQDIRKQMLTRELYEAYRTADVERMTRIEKTLEMIASRP